MIDCQPVNRMAGITGHRKVSIIFALWGVILFWLPTWAWNTETSEWKLQASAEKALIRLDPDRASPVIATAPGGTIFKSNEKKGEWFRVLAALGKQGIMMNGYIASEDVEILEGKIFQEQDLQEEEENGEFHGFGISLKIRGEGVDFPGGDINKGTGGLFDQRADDLSSSGFTLGRSDKQPLHLGYGGGGSITYNFTPRIGIGIGVDFIRAIRQSFLLFSEPTYPEYHMTSTPQIDIFSLRLELFYLLPVHRLLTICFNAGPVLYFSEYKYSLNVTTTNFGDDLYQNAKARQLGFQGGVGLEISLNPRVALILEAQGRYAKIAGFEGKEITYNWQDGLFSTSEENGLLYFVEGEKYPKLAVLSTEPASDQNTRKAVLNFSGVSLLVGLRFKF